MNIPKVPDHQDCPAIIGINYDGAPRTVTLDLRITVPAGTPMIDFARAMSQFASAVNGRWAHRPAPGLPQGRFEVEGRP